jgi:hypothetical protein
MQREPNHESLLLASNRHIAVQGSVGQRGRAQAFAPPSVHGAATAPLCTVAGHLLAANDAALVLLIVQRSRQCWMKTWPGKQPLSPPRSTTGNAVGCSKPPVTAWRFGVAAPAPGLQAALRRKPAHTLVSPAGRRDSKSPKQRTTQIKSGKHHPCPNLTSPALAAEAAPAQPGSPPWQRCDTGLAAHDRRQCYWQQQHQAWQQAWQVQA